MKHLLKAIALGVSLALTSFISMFVLDSYCAGDSTLPIVERCPATWVYFWPDLFLSRLLGYDSFLFLLMEFLCNAAVYSVLAYAFFRWREKHIQLP
jgi:hypothetical protein